MRATRPVDRSKSPYEAALLAALDDLAQVQSEIAAAREGLASREGRAAEVIQLIRSLVAMLPPERASSFLQCLREAGVKSQPSTRAGPVYDNVIELFAKNRRRDWSAAEVQAALTDRGAQADPKAVYNVLGYLVRRGRLKRYGRGRYLLVDLGVGIELDQDLEGVEPGGECSED
jgi:hypothetical protein